MLSPRFDLLRAATIRRWLRYKVNAQMPAHRAELLPDGPWITIRGKESALTFSLRELVRDLVPAEQSSSHSRIMAWRAASAPVSASTVLLHAGMSIVAPPSRRLPA
jgi:hypothetical protein